MKQKRKIQQGQRKNHQNHKKTGVNEGKIKRQTKEIIIEYIKICLNRI